MNQPGQNERRGFGPAAAGGALVLFLLNSFVCWKLYSIEYLKYMSSIEGAYIAIARYAMENWRDLSWFPLWYAGIPYQNTYPPLLHLLVAAVAKVTGSSPAGSFHAVSAAIYCLGPVTLFWMALRLSGRRTASLAAGLLYSLVSPAAFLISHVRGDLGGLWHVRRLHTLVFYGDGPFVASLMLVPLAIVFLDDALRKRRPLSYFLAAVAMAAAVLTNWLGGSTLALAVTAYLLGTADRGRRVWPAAAGTAALAYLLASPWIPPSTLRVIQANAQTIGGFYQIAWKHAMYAIALGAAVYGLHTVFERLRCPRCLRTALYFLLFTGSVTLLAEWAEIYLLPQPHRYHLPMEMAICLSLAFLCSAVLRRLPRGYAVAVPVLAAALALIQVIHLRSYAAGLIQPVEIRTTTEYKTARWLDQHIRGKRVMVPGSSAHFFNIFTDTPQFAGGFEQGDGNWESRVARHTIYTGQNAGERDGEISVLWLKAFGVRAVAVGGQKSGEHYKPFHNPYKFAPLLPELHRDGDDFIYSVPARSDSLAHVMPPDDVVRTAPVHGLDVAQLRRYVAALENSAYQLATFEWTSRHSARIVAELKRGDVISVQVTYHPGWRAEVNGVRQPARQDAIGLMVIEPLCEGRCKVDLVYDGGIEMKAAKTLSVGSFVGCLVWAFAVRKRRGGVRA